MPASTETLVRWEPSDGYPINVRITEPAVAVKGHIVALHGIQSHSGWYGWSSAKLAEAGYCVHFMDRRGSGLNWQARGDAPGWRRLVDDVIEYVRELNARDPEAKFLMAGSWGGKVATVAARELGEELSGLILWCPGFFARVRPSFGERLRIALAKLARPRKLFPIPLSDPALFTANPEQREFIANDPLTIHYATARLLVASVLLDRQVRQCAPGLNIPVLLLLAERDRIIDSARTRIFVEGWQSNDKRTIEYPNVEHTLEFEPKPERFVNDVISWLDAHAGA